jgi:lipoprotein-releasing system permease protein
MIQKSFTFIAYRYLWTKGKNNTIGFMIKVCFLGILIASSSLALVVSIMTGFEKATYEKIQSIYPDLIISGNGEQFEMQQLGNILNEQEYKIQNFTLQKTGQALIYNPEISKTPMMFFLNGISTVKPNKLSTKIISKKDETLEQLLKKNNVLIGSKLAQTADLFVGSDAYILYTHDEPTGLHLTFQQAKVTVSGIFKTGIEEFDNNSIYCNHDFFDSLFPESSNEEIHVTLLPDVNHEHIAQTLSKRLETDVYSWCSLYPTLISALKLEKWAMSFILLLIVFVASMNIISLISMYVEQKKKDIAILICLGMNTSSIRAIFITISLIISYLATSLGLLAAYGLGKALQAYPFIKLPESIYDTDYLPIKLEAYVFLTIFILTIMISFFASLLATRNIEKIRIVETLKNQ